MHKSYPQAKVLPLAQSLKLLLCPWWREQHSESQQTLYVLKYFMGSGACMLSLGSHILRLWDLPPPHSIMVCSKMPFALSGWHCIWSEEAITAMAGFLLLIKKCLRLGLSSCGHSCSQAAQETWVCNSRCSVLDRLTVSRQHSDPFCSEVSFC